MGEPYTHLQVEAALCVWEYLNDVTLLDSSRQDPQWVALRKRRVVLRAQVIPAIVDRCRARLDGLPTIRSWEFPSVEATASLIARWALYEDYERHVQHAVSKTEIGYIAFVPEHREEIEQAFADGVEPEAFVARLVALSTAEEVLAS